MPDGTTKPTEDVDPNAPLGTVPPWPVLFSLPPKGERALEMLRKVRIGPDRDRFPSTRAVFSALILYMPEDAWTIAALSQFSAAAGPAPPAGSTIDKLRRRTQVRLPPPLSLRLNRLIERASEETGQRCSRTAIVVSMMQQARRPSEQALWRERFTTVLLEPAKKAVPRADRKRPEVVLRIVAPRPGPRPQGMAPVMSREDR